MSELSRLPQELAYFDPGGEVVMSMTGASFAEARNAGVVHISPNRDAMTTIARVTGFIEEGENLPPLVLFARSGEEKRALISRWDDRWPEYDDQPIEGYYFSAASIGNEYAANGPSEEIAAYAKHIGAKAISEITIPSWSAESSRVGAFATALLLGQRPIEPPKRPSVLNRISSELLSTNDSRRRLGLIKLVEKDNSLAEPFIITRQAAVPPAQ